MKKLREKVIKTTYLFQLFRSGKPEIVSWKIGEIQSSNMVKLFYKQQQTFDYRRHLQLPEKFLHLSETLFMPTVHLIIKGKVQGVFYRATAKKIADEKGVTGWVQNTPEGNVEIVATAPHDALQSFVEWCYTGPSRARVTGIDKKELEEQVFEDFRVHR